MVENRYNLKMCSHTSIDAPLYSSLFILYCSIDERRRQHFPDKQEEKIHDFDLVRPFSSPVISPRVKCYLHALALSAFFLVGCF